MFQNKHNTNLLSQLTRNDIHTLMAERIKNHCQLDEEEKQANQMFVSKLLSIDFNWDRYQTPYIN